MSEGVFTAKRKFWAMSGKVSVFDPEGQLVCFVQQKLFKLKEEITVYRDESKSDAVMVINARQVIDFSAVYDITDAQSGEKIGAVKRKGLKSLVRDKWELLDSDDRRIADLEEVSGLGALLRRFINLIPQKYRIVLPDGREAARFDQQFSFVVHTMRGRFLEDQPDRRLMLAAWIMLLIIEGRQS